jgi:hypothetical protein
LSLLAQAVGTLDIQKAEDMYATPESRHVLNLRTALASRKSKQGDKLKALIGSDDLETEVNEDE